MLVYLDREGCQKGPCEFERLRGLLASGVVTLDTQVKILGSCSWMPLSAYIQNYGLKLEDRNCCPDCKTGIEFGMMNCPKCSRPFLPESRTPLGYFLMSLQLYSTFSGRATRAEFLAFRLFVLIFSWLPIGAGWWILSGEDSVWGMVLLLLGIVVGLALMVPDAAVISRRCHDTWMGAGINGPGALFIITFNLFFADSEYGANKFGPPTKYPVVKPAIFSKLSCGPIKRRPAFPVGKSGAGSDL